MSVCERVSLRVVVQSEVDECLVRCVATHDGQETNNGINTAPVSLSVSLFLSPALWLLVSHFLVVLFGRSTPTLECAGAGSTELIRFCGLDS